MAPQGQRGRTKSERMVVDAIRRQLLPGEVLLENLRLTDAQAGDVEIDLAVLIPMLGIAVIEIKGGTIEYRDGEWTSRTANGIRRIKPVEQVRRGKHALRNFLSRNGVTGERLAHTEWFIAMPHTVVDGDMGPEAVAETLLGANEISNAMQLVRTRLVTQVTGDSALTESQIEQALELLQRQAFEPLTMTRADILSLSRYGLIVLAYSTAAYFVAELFWVSLVAGIWASIAIGAISWWCSVRFHSRTTHLPRHIAWVTIAAILLGLGIGDSAAHISFIKAARGCDINYASCVPRQPEVDCIVVGDEVAVLGKDVYALDPDNDGIACEWHEFFDASN